MATKKTAAKKATAKKTVTKKVVKRAYKRKPKVAPAVEEATPVMPEQATVTLTEDQLEAIKMHARYEGASNYAETEVERQVGNIDTRREDMSSFEFLDISDLPPETRLALAIEFDSMGFMSSKLNPILSGDFVGDLMVYPVIKFNHVNKIIEFVGKSCRTFTDSKAIGRPLKVGFDLQIIYSAPGDNLPEVINKDGATYVRVG